MTNFRKTVVTFAQRLWRLLTFSTDVSEPELSSLIRPSAPRTYSVGSDGSIRTLRPLTGTVHLRTNEALRLISADEASRYGITDSWWQDFSIIGQSGESLLSKSEDACTSSSETETYDRARLGRVK